MQQLNKPELLAPAGNLEKLKMAIIYGADAVYLGGKKFGLRAYGGNFSTQQMIEGVKFAHDRGRKVYVTANIFPHNSDINSIMPYLQELVDINVDAVLVSDIGLFMLIKQNLPQLEVHISTQANNTNWAAVKAWQDLGAARVVLARELSFNEIQEIRDKTNVELEMFVHGAMCISYSGRCLISNYLTGRDSNRGACTQPCRWKYNLTEEKRPGQYFPITEDSNGTYFFNSKDMCLLPYLPDIIKCGVNSLKIEGRMKSIHYVASVVSAYRHAIDNYFNDPEHFTIKQEWIDELNKVSHREYTSGFSYHKTSTDDQIYNTTSYEHTSDFVGLVLKYDQQTQIATIQQRNHMTVGQEIEFFQPDAPLFKQTITQMFDDQGNSINVAPHPQQIITMKMNKPVVPYTILRRDCQWEKAPLTTNQRDFFLLPAIKKTFQTLPWSSALPLHPRTVPDRAA